MKKLSIIVLFCDKDYQYIPNLLLQLNEKLACSYELILVDNRDKTKDIPIPEISNYYDFNDGRVLSFGKNLGQLAAKKLALSYCNSDYVWFFDGDDKLCDYISQRLLNKCKEDIIIFNYGYYFDEGSYDVNSVTYIDAFIGSKRKINGRKYKDIEFLNTKACCTCWNKWYKTSLLRSFFNVVPEDKVLSCGEDVWINAAAFSKAKTLRFDESTIYMNVPHRGLSNGTITSLENFTKVIQGFEEVYKLYERVFKKQNKLYNKNFKRHSDIGYLISRVLACEESVQPEAMKLLISKSSEDELLARASENDLSQCFEQIKRLIYYSKEDIAMANSSNSASQYGTCSTCQTNVGSNSCTGGQTIGCGPSYNGCSSSYNNPICGSGYSSCSSSYSGSGRHNPTCSSYF